MASAPHLRGQLVSLLKKGKDDIHRRFFLERRINKVYCDIVLYRRKTLVSDFLQ